MSHPSDLQVLARFAATLDASTVPPTILRTAKACLLYGLAVGIGTRRARPAELALAAARCEEVSGPVTRLLDGARVPHGNAAFANAVLLSGRVQGDSHPCGHLGGVVIPAALASAERHGSSGAALLAAQMAGYEVALRIGRDHAADLSVRGFRTTPSYGVFGAAVAAGRLAGFDAERIAAAISLAANFAGGLREYVDAGSEESPFQAGFAARNGLYAADVASRGLVATPTALHGGAGFFRAFARDDVDYGARLVEGLGSHFEFTTVTFKQYPACQFLRGIISGLAALRERAGSTALEAVELRMHPYEADFIGVRFAGPFVSPAQTVMSAPFCAALAWVAGTASFTGLRTYDDARVLDIVRRVTVITDPGCQRYEPLITATLADGRRLEWKERAGDSGYRITWEAARQMTDQLCAEVDVPPATTAALVLAVDSIETAPTVARLVAAVTAATTA
jgi:2-methylcitrate dehydratase PrpD